MPLLQSMTTVTAESFLLPSVHKIRPLAPTSRRFNLKRSGILHKRQNASTSLTTRWLLAILRLGPDTDRRSKGTELSGESKLKIRVVHLEIGSCQNRGRRLITSKYGTPRTSCWLAIGDMIESYISARDHDTLGDGDTAQQLPTSPEASRPSAKSSERLHGGAEF